MNMEEEEISYTQDELEKDPEKPVSKYILDPEWDSMSTWDESA